MNWDHKEDNWVQLAGNVDERWDNLTESRLASRVQDTYGMTDGEDDDAPPQLTDWQQRVSEMKRVAAREALS